MLEEQIRQYVAHLGLEPQNHSGEDVNGKPFLYVFEDDIRPLLSNYQKFHGFIPDFLISDNFQPFGDQLGVKMTTDGFFIGDAYFFTLNDNGLSTPSDWNHELHLIEKPDKRNSHYQLFQTETYLLPDQALFESLKTTPLAKTAPN